MRRPSLKWILRGLAGVLGALLLLALTVVITLRTDTGTRWIFNRVAALVPGEIIADELEGTIWSGLRIPAISYRDEVRQLRASNVELRIDWASATLGKVVFRELNAESANYHNLAPGEPGPFDLSLEPVSIAIGIKRSRIGRLTVSGGETELEFRKISVEGARAAKHILSIAGVSATIANLDLSIQRLEAEMAEDIPIRLNLTWSQAGGGWSGQGGFRGSLAALDFEHSVTGPYPAAATGTISLLHRVEPEFDMRVNWGNWRFAEYSTEAGVARLSGTIDDYKADYELTLLTPQNLRARVSGTAAGDASSLREFAARMESTAGNAEALGTLAWAPVVSVDAGVHVRGFDPAILHPKLTGNLEAEARVALVENEPVQVSVAGIHGVLNDASIAARGDISWAQDRIRCERCTLSAGDNRIDLDGVSDARSIAMHLKIDARNLETLWPDLKGRLTADGQVNGSLARPLFAGELRGQELSYAEWSANEIAVSSQATGLETLDLAMNATALSYAGTDLGDLSVRAAGNTGQLSLEVGWEGFTLGTSAQLELTRNEDGFEGVISDATVWEPNTGSWTMAGPLGFRFDGRELAVDKHSWSNPAGQLRVSRFLSAGNEHRLVAEFADLPLQTVNAFIAPKYQLRGTGHADIDLALKGGAWAGSIAWQQSGTVLSVLQENGRHTEIAIPGVTVDSRFVGSGAEVTSAITIEPGISAALELSLSRLSKDSDMLASLQLRGEDWGWISAILPQIDKFEGMITANIGASGPLLNPEFSGSLALRGGRLAIPALNVPLEDIELDVTGAAHGAARISGLARAGDGRLEIAGGLVDAMRSTRQLEFRLSGQAAHLLDWPEYRLWVSPDLVITATSAGWTVYGDLAVPEADIRVRELPVESISPSPDIRIAGAEEEPVAPTAYSGEVRITLGEDTHVELLGLETRLAGELRVRMPRDRPLSAEGQVTLTDGVFSAYRQKLTIQQGILTFTGPLDNPLVDVKAARVIESLEGPVTAGIHLSGRAQNLVSVVYSEPAMADADALSYLVLGRPLSEATSAEGDYLSGAAIALSLGRATQITEQIGRSFGLDQLTLAGDGGEATALVAGKQINSRLYARYAYGVFSRIGTLLLRYQLNRRLMLEAGASETQSINILYTVKKH